MDEFAYFMIRIRRPAARADAAPLTGVIERLGSGEKCAFEGPEELIRLVGGWATLSADSSSHQEREAR